MCDLWQHRSRGLSLDECKEFIRQLKKFVPAPFEINLMGGEPFLKEWILDLCNFIRRCGYVSIISTNAYLIDKEMARCITDSGLDSLAISLESLNPETHDFLRGQKGVFKKVMDAIDYLTRFKTKRTPYLTILAIIMEKNLDEILELTEWVNQTEALDNISFLALLRPDSTLPEEGWHKCSKCKRLWPQDINRVHNIIDELIRLKREGYKINNPISQLEAFKKYYIDPVKFMRETEYKIYDYIIDLESDGDVFLSGELLFNIRNSKTYRLDKFWFLEKANNIRNKIDKYGAGKRICVINFIVTFPKDSDEEKKEYDCRSHQGLGELYLQKGNLAKAIDEFNQTLKLDPKNEHAHRGLGMCFQHNKQFNRAIDEFRRVLEINPSNKYAHIGLANCYKSLRQFDQAIAEFNEAVKINPESEHIHQTLGFCYKDSKQFDKAIDEFRQVLKINPKNEHGYLGFGFCYFEQREIEKAIEKFDQALKVNPKNEHAHHGLGLCYQYNKQFDRAINEFEQAFKINPKNVNIHESLTFYYKDSKQYDKAIDEFKQLLKISPENEHYHHGLGCCYESLKQFDKAIDELKKVLEINPNNKDASHCLESCLAAMKQQGK